MNTVSTVHKKLSLPPLSSAVEWGIGFGLFGSFLLMPAIEILIVDLAARYGVVQVGQELDNLGTLVLRILILVTQLSVVLAWVRYFAKDNFYKSLSLRKPTKADASVLMRIIGVYAAVVIFVLPIVLSLFLSPETINQSQEIGIATNDIPLLELLLSALALLVLVPVVEEIVYRGVMFQGIAKYTGVWPAAIVSSALFGVAHGQVNVGIDTFILGFLSCVLLLKTRNLWMSIFLHSMKNGVAFMILFVSQSL